MRRPPKPPGPPRGPRPSPRGPRGRSLLPSRLDSEGGWSFWATAKIAVELTPVSCSKAESCAGMALVDEVAFGSAVRSVFTAVRMKMRSPQTIGEALPRPGIATFHLTFFVVDHSVGGFPLGATPVASGPRHWGQLSSL